MPSLHTLLLGSTVSLVIQTNLSKILLFLQKGFAYVSQELEKWEFVEIDITKLLGLNTLNFPFYCT